MSLRSRISLLVAAAALAVGAAACSGGTTSGSPTLPPAEATACVATGAFAEAVQQFEGVDVQAIGASNLAPQVNRLRSTFIAVGSALDFVDVPSEQELRNAWTVFDAALGQIDPASPTQEEVDAAKAEAGPVTTAFGKVRTELGCPK